MTRAFGVPLFSIFLLISFSIFADQSGPCGSDAKKLCSGVKFGKGNVFECLAKQNDRLSSECRSHIKRSKEYKRACRKEIQSDCKGLSFFCLLYASKSKVSFSSECLPKILVGATYIKHCKSEIQTFCKEKKSPSKIVHCLRAHENQLTPKCHSQLKK